MMAQTKSSKSVGLWNSTKIEPGEAADVTLAIGESYSGITLEIPIHVRRGPLDGPVVFVTAALHGDEINGTGAVRTLIQDESFYPLRGSVILVPVLNLLGFDRHSRYLPDRRDLNRSFPGSKNGSLASRMAMRIFEEIVRRSDFGIDLHTAAVRRTNYPNVRGDMSNPKVKKLAMAFGCELNVSSKGPIGSLRRESCANGCPTIIMEGGEVWKVEPGIMHTAVRGIKNVLIKLDMLKGEIQTPDLQLTIERSKWLRATRGGFLQFHVRPGAIVEKDQPLVSNTTLLGKEQHVAVSPFDAVVIGMTTLPAVSPGEPICNLGRLPKSVEVKQLMQRRAFKGDLAEQVSDELASNMMIVESDRS